MGDGEELRVEGDARDDSRARDRCRSTWSTEPAHANLYANAGPIARHALEFYSKLWAPYPFPQLTLQDGPSAGMEYPMVINSNQGAADHETGHQWWPMMVGNNETWYGWMDEGFNQYMNILSDADSRPGAEPQRLGQSYGRTSGNEEEPPMMWDANYAGNMYSFQTYSKTPLMLSMLGGIVGDAEVQHAMSEYTKAWAFKHPSPWDYIFFMDKALGQDLNWFWYYWLWTTESVDGSIADVATTGARTTVTVRQDGQMPSPVVLKVKFAASGPAIKPMPNAKMRTTRRPSSPGRSTSGSTAAAPSRRRSTSGGRSPRSRSIPAAGSRIAIPPTTSGRRPPRRRHRPHRRRRRAAAPGAPLPAVTSPLETKSLGEIPHL